MAERIVVIGLPTPFPLPEVALVVGGRRHLAAVTLPPAARLAILTGDFEAVWRTIAFEPGPVVVLASGDPGFFGVVRALAERFGPGTLEVRPAPSSVSLAFARLGLPWDDALVVSAHGRPMMEAAAAVCRATKAAVLMSPDNAPAALGKQLLALGAAPADVAVCARLGLAGETVHRTDLDGLAAGTWDALSVVVILREPRLAPSAQLAWTAAGSGIGAQPAPLGPTATGAGSGSGIGSFPGSMGWGRPEAAFDHRGGMVTKAEVRAVAIGKLELPLAGVLWDVGAGCGSVAIECALLSPGLEVYAIERNPEDAHRVEANARELGAEVSVVAGVAPSVLDALPAPDRVFAGGGGLGVLDAVTSRLRPGGRVVATFAALDRAAAAADRLGHLVQIGASRGERLPGGGWRLAAQNPVFVVWGFAP